VSALLRHHRRLTVAIAAIVISLGSTAGVLAAVSSSGPAALRLEILDKSSAWNPASSTVFVGLHGHRLKAVVLHDRRGHVELSNAVATRQWLRLVVATTPMPTPPKEERFSNWVRTRSVPSVVNGTLIIRDQTVQLDVLGIALRTCRSDPFAVSLQNLDNIQFRTYEAYFSIGDGDYQWDGHWYDNSPGGRWIHATKAQLFVTLVQRSIPIYERGIAVLRQLVQASAGYGPIHRAAELMLNSYIAQEVSYRYLAMADNPNLDASWANAIAAREQDRFMVLNGRWFSLDQWLGAHADSRSACNR
jgi:hypothetical protein